MRNFIQSLAVWLLIKTSTYKEETMLAILFAQRVILAKPKSDGTPTTFADVPAKLKAQVADVLVNECGVPELVPVEYGGTMTEQA